jgi:DNA-directed RNA polymerase subunit M/transcription elongation factor TFIIS
MDYYYECAECGKQWKKDEVKAVEACPECDGPCEAFMDCPVCNNQMIADYDNDCFNCSCGHKEHYEF